MTAHAPRCEPPEGLRDWKPRFGDLICNGWASENNPTRVGAFVRRGVRTGNLNRGPYWELTDGKGKFWELSEKSDRLTLVSRAPTPDALAALVRAARDVSLAAWTDRWGRIHGHSTIVPLEAALAPFGDIPHA